MRVILTLEGSNSGTASSLMTLMFVPARDGRCDVGEVAVDIFDCMYSW